MKKPTKTTDDSDGRDALGRTPAEREAFIERLSGVIREREAREMKAPLTKAEIRAGIARLMASPLMTSAEGRKGDDGKPDNYTGALDSAGDARCNTYPRLYDLGEKWGLEGNEPGVIEELGLALLLSRLTVEELFRLGTSPEAMALFEEYEAREKAWRVRHPVAKPAEATS